MSRRWIAALALAVFAGFAAACSSGGGGEMTVAEYADWCGNHEILDNDDLDTIEEYINKFQNIRDDFENVSSRVPASLGRFHAFASNYFQLLVSDLEQLDPDGTIDLYGDDSESLDYRSANVERAGNSLSESAREAFINSGCDL